MTQANTDDEAGTTGPEECELRYLLTAYLFDNISEAGRREVETELERSPRSRDELDDLRRTLDLVQDALHSDDVLTPGDAAEDGSENDGAADDGSGNDGQQTSPRYAFEERRLRRVLEASRRHRPRSRRALRIFGGLTAAALVLFAVVGIGFLQLGLESGAPGSTTDHASKDTGYLGGLATRAADGKLGNEREADYRAPVPNSARLRPKLKRDKANAKTPLDETSDLVVVTAAHAAVPSAAGSGSTGSKSAGTTIASERGETETLRSRRDAKKASPRAPSSEIMLAKSRLEPIDKEVEMEPGSRDAAKAIIERSPEISRQRAAETAESGARPPGAAGFALDAGSRGLNRLSKIVEQRRRLPQDARQIRKSAEKAPGKRQTPSIAGQAAGENKLAATEGREAYRDGRISRSRHDPTAAGRRGGSSDEKSGSGDDPVASFESLALADGSDDLDEHAGIRGRKQVESFKRSVRSRAAGPPTRAPPPGQPPGGAGKSEPEIAARIRSTNEPGQDIPTTTTAVRPETRVLEKLEASTGVIGGRPRKGAIMAGEDESPGRSSGRSQRYASTLEKAMKRAKTVDQLERSSPGDAETLSWREVAAKESGQQSQKAARQGQARDGLAFGRTDAGTSRQEDLQMADRWYAWDRQRVDDTLAESIDVPALNGRIDGSLAARLNDEGDGDATVVVDALGTHHVWAGGELVDLELDGLVLSPTSVEAVTGGIDVLDADMDGSAEVLEEELDAKDDELVANSGLQSRRLGARAIASGKPRVLSESRLRTWGYYKNIDSQLSPALVEARRLSIPAPVVGDEGLGESGFRARYGVTPFVSTRRAHQSTVGMDVDDAGWARARESLRGGALPPAATVRVEEFVNHFPEQRPADPSKVFTVRCEGGPSPFGDDDLELLEITVKSRELLPDERKDAILTFAVDTSGSMALDGKLELVRNSVKTLVANLQPTDRVAIVAFSNHAYVALPHTSGRQQETIRRAIDSLTPTGGTNVGAGIELAYRLANEARSRRAANRVILCSDGVATLGSRGPDEVLTRVRRYAQENLVSLFTYGFGSGGKKAVEGDEMLRRLANEGDGNYRYVDSESAAQELFSLPEKLQLLAADAKIQVEFDPDVVTHYRLLGYEKRDIADQDFRNDARDAGEVGPGSTVTVLYELERHSQAASLGRIFLRYRDVSTRRVEEFDYDLPTGVIAASLASTSDRFRFTAAVAELAELLRESYFARNGSYGAVLRLLDGLSPMTRERGDWQETRELASRALRLSAARALESLTSTEMRSK